jgi:predicted Zn-dependent protease/transglutaminase-like putative cysteine protease
VSVTGFRHLRALALLAMAALTFLFAGDATADIGDRFADLERLSRDVAGAKDSPRVYAALRAVWREWDQGDPAEVEEILHEQAADATMPAPARAYAALLEAYARRRRGDLDGARSEIAGLGYVGRWMIVGPFDNEGKVGLDRSYGPEEERRAPLSTARAYDGKERTVRWRVSPAVSPFGWFDVGAFVRPQEKICAYVATSVRDVRTKTKGGARPISIWVGSAGALRVWWNGTEVLRDDKYRDLDSDRFATGVELKAGWNRLLVKLCGEDASPMLSLRLAGPNGEPDDALETDPDPAHTAEAPPATVAARVTRAVEGPIQAFERRIKSGAPEELEAYARYLVATQSDDPNEHRARELARRAADRAPTIDLLLLAADLAEGRNQRAVWIDKAEALARKGATTRERVAVLLARGGHVRGGSNWRDAVPYYDQVLAIDPDNVAATLARFELYSAAGLRDTALAFLNRALERRPRSVALVRSLAAALREQDRTTEADEVEERYVALRFDDPIYTRERIDLAAARRDAPATSRWVERLIATNPDSAAALGAAAHAFQVLGDRPRAVAMYRRALDLAPEDTEGMRSLADVYGEAGQADEQVKLLKSIVELLPQSKDVRDYLAHLEPSKPRADEAYARPAAEFLSLRGAPSNGQSRRTLVDLQVTTVFPNGLASRFHQVVFQPLTNAAAAEEREYAFGFEADTEAVQLRGARVYRADGHVDAAAESGEGPADNPALSTYTSARAYYVHFPRLEPGDVVELQYRVEDVAPRNAFADYFGEIAYLQSNELTVRSEYVLITPKSRAFYFNHPNVKNLSQDVSERGDSRIYHFLARDVVPAEPEALQPPYPELLGHIHVSTYKTWNDVGLWYWGLVKDQFVADDEVRRRTAEVTKGLTTADEKVRAIYDYVVQKTRYVALEFGIHGFKPYRCAQIFARGFGDCKDKATLIVTMLREVGIPATIVIVRTGLKGEFDTEPASLAPFDHAIAYVPSLDRYLDGTAEYTGSTELPAIDRGALALQINEGHPKLVHLPDPPAAETRTLRTVDAVLSPDGSAQIDWRADVSGASASSWRQKYHAGLSRKERLQEDLAGEFPSLSIGAVEAGDMEDVEQPVWVRVRGRVPQLARKDSDAMSVPVGPAEHLVRDYASLSVRRLDLRLRARTETDTDWRIHVPPGMRVTSLPHGAEASSPFGTFKVEVTSVAGTVHVRTMLSLSKTHIPTAEYPAFRAWCETVDRGLGQRLVVAGK